MIHTPLVLNEKEQNMEILNFFLKNAWNISIFKNLSIIWLFGISWKLFMKASKILFIYIFGTQVRLDSFFNRFFRGKSTHVPHCTTIFCETVKTSIKKLESTSNACVDLWVYVNRAITSPHGGRDT